MKLRPSRLSRLLVASAMALILSTGARASTIGVTTGTLPMSTLGAPSGTRELIELEPSGAQWVGRTQASVVEQVVLTAPGIQRAVLMLREVRQADGRIALHLAADPALANATVRATLILRDDTPRYLVTTSAAGEPIEAAPHRVATAHGERLVVQLDRLGSVWLVEGRGPAERASSEHTARALLGSRSVPGWLPLGAGLVLLLVARAASRWAHRYQAHRGA